MPHAKRPAFLQKQKDCDDNNENIHPGAFDFCDDAIDQDCDGNDTCTVFSELALLAGLVVRIYIVCSDICREGVEKIPCA